jgi:hypothetical protein
MKTIRKLAVGSLVGMALTFGLAGVAGAASTTSTTAGSTTTGPTTTGSTAGGSTTTTTPTASTPAKVKNGTLAPNQIWRIVNSHHKISCGRATKELKRIDTADQAAGKRVTRWGKMSAEAAKMSAGKKADQLAKHDAGRTRYLQKLQKEGAALIKRIEAKCGVTASTS